MRLLRPYRWFDPRLPGWAALRGGPDAWAPPEGAVVDPAGDGWDAWGRADAASGGRARTRALPRAEVAALADELSVVLGRAVTPEAAVCLAGAELAALACSPPGQEVPLPWDVVLHELLEVEDPALVDAWLAGRTPPPAAPLPAPTGAPASWGAAVVGDEVRVRVRTAGWCWLRREPLPPAYHGTDTPLPPVPEAGAVVALAADTVDLPASWRTDLWLSWLDALPAVALAAAFGPDDVACLDASTAGTAVAAPLRAAVGEHLLLSGAVAATDVPRTPAERAAALALALDGVTHPRARALWTAAREWSTGLLDVRSPAVVDGVVRPLRAALLAGRSGDAGAAVALLREAGGPIAVDLVRSSLVGDGTVSPAEWTEYVGDGPGRGA